MSKPQRPTSGGRPWEKKAGHGGPRYLFPDGEEARSVFVLPLVFFFFLSVALFMLSKSPPEAGKGKKYSPQHGMYSWPSPKVLEVEKHLK